MSPPTTRLLCRGGLGVPAAYFYCEDADLAALLVAYAAAAERDKKKMLRSLSS